MKEKMTKPSSVYIHIPFCNKICNYCDFCKMLYDEKIIDLYLEELKKEIYNNYDGNKIKTLYIGGGSPSCLNEKQFNKLLEIIDIFNLDDFYEMTIEINPDIKEKILSKICLSRINRVSIGIETFNKKMMKVLNRESNYRRIKQIILKLNKHNIYNINIDLIYGINGQSMFALKKDLKKFIKLGAFHISTYSLIKEKNTVLFVNDYKEIADDLCSKMYFYIKKYLVKKGYVHYEISNFAKKGYESNHNNVYWNNDHYYGFGLGASGYIGNTRYTNTRSINNYLLGNYVYEKEEVTKKIDMENFMILGLRKIKGISKEEFKSRYKKDISKVFNISNLKETDDYLSLKESDLFVSNEILIDFVGGSNNEK